MAGRAQAFGKIPSVGDFFRLGAGQGFVSVWDDWVQTAMLGAQSALGAGWDAAYMSAPIWRFTLAAGLAGPQAVMGVFMPSVDRVGRRFPLTLLCPLDCADPGLCHFANDRFFAAAETLALAALEDDMTRDRLQAGLDDLPLPVAPQPALMNGTIHAATPDAIAAALASRALGAPRQPSLWTAAMTDDARFLLSDGLPDAPRALGLFDLTAPIWAPIRKETAI